MYWVHAPGQGPHIHVTNWFLLAVVMVAASALTASLGLWLGTVVDPRKISTGLPLVRSVLDGLRSFFGSFAETIDRALKPKGVAVMIEAVHQCMSIRGVKKPDVATITTQFTGIFKEDPAQQARFMMLATERGRG